MSRAAFSASLTSRFAAVAAPAAALFACLAVAACQGSQAPLIAGGGIGGGIGPTDASTRAACAQHAEEVYNQRNRADIYAPQSSVNAPYSANYNPGSTDRGLSEQFAHSAMIRDCVRNTGTETNRDVPPPPSTGAVNRP